MKLYLLTVLLLFTLSCASKTIYINHTETTAAQSAKSFTCCKNDCGNSLFSIESVEDTRRNKENLGRIAGNLILEKDVADWLKNNFYSLSECGMIFISPDEKKSSAHEIIDIVLDLKMAYAHSLSTSASSNLVIKITYKHKSQIIRDKIYRGTYTGMNWWSSESEANDSFQQALLDILNQVSCDMQEICRIPRSKQ